MLVIEQTLRRTHRLHERGRGGARGRDHVQDVAHRANVNLPDNDVTRVARAAAQLARGLVAGDGPGVDDALHCLGTRLAPSRLLRRPRRVISGRRSYGRGYPGRFTLRTPPVSLRCASLTAACDCGPRI